MELYTKIRLPKPRFYISYEDRILMLGSCFAENIGAQLENERFNVDINPFGTLYNPSSVSEALRLLANPRVFSADNLFEHDGAFHSFSHHSRFSSTSVDECLQQINSRISQSSIFLKNATKLVITLGSSFVYRLKSDGKIVANCHKLPEVMFSRERLSVDDIVSDWEELLHHLWNNNEELKILFTVSPIRHWRDGAHENQLSKATLLLAVDELLRREPGRIDYFPAYEIMMDELRDYRFYADDMVHPSSLAIGYIWQRFSDCFLSEDCKKIVAEWSEIKKSLQHRPFRPNSEAHKQFMFQTLLKMERLIDKFPYFDITKEIEILKSKLK